MRSHLGGDSILAPLSYPILQSSIQVDVAILGSGLTAMTAALELQRAGCRVALVAPGVLIEDATRSRAKCVDIAEPPEHSRWHHELGVARASAVAAAYRAAIDELQTESDRYPGRHCVRAPNFTVAEFAEDLLSIERKCTMVRALRGDCWFTRNAPSPFQCAGASRDTLQGKVQLSPMLRAMASELQKRGAQVYEDSRCKTTPKLGRECEIETEQGKITANSLLFATRTSHHAMSSIFAALAPHHSYLIATRSDAAIDDAVFLLENQPRRMFWQADREDPHRLILRADYWGDEGDRQSRKWDELCCYAASHLTLRRVDARWSTHHLVARDGLPLVGRIPGVDNAYLAAGLGQSELPWGVSCGSMLARLIQGESSPLEELFEPGRFIRDQWSGQSGDSAPLTAIDLSNGGQVIDSKAPGQVVAPAFPVGHRVALSNAPTRKVVETSAPLRRFPQSSYES